MTDANFATFLNTELAKRQIANTSYSLRAFARDLNIEPSLLSKIIRRKIPVTLKMLERLAPSAGLNEPELSTYREFVKNAELLKNNDSQQDKQVREKDLKLIRDWYHVAIAEFAATADFNPTAGWVADKLGMSEPEAVSAVERLVNLGFLEKKEDGRLRLFSLAKG